MVVSAQMVKEVKSFSEPDASKLPWKDLNIDVVLECNWFLH